MRDCRAGNGSQVVLRRSALRNSQLLKPPTLMDTCSEWWPMRNTCPGVMTQWEGNPGVHDHRMTAVGFEPTPLRTGAWSQRLRPLGQTVLTKWPLVLVGQALCTSIHTTARKHSCILPGEWWAVPCRCGSDVWGAASSCIMYRPKSGLRSHGYIAQWLERLTADQQVPGSNPGVPFCLYVLLTSIDRKPSVQKSGHPESNQGPSDGCMDLQSDALPAEL